MKITIFTLVINYLLVCPGFTMEDITVQLYSGNEENTHQDIISIEALGNATNKPKMPKSIRDQYAPHRSTKRRKTTSQAENTNSVIDSTEKDEKIYRFHEPIRFFNDNIISNDHHEKKPVVLYLAKTELWVAKNPQPIRELNGTLPLNTESPQGPGNLSHEYIEDCALWIASPGKPWELYIIKDRLNEKLVTKEEKGKLSRAINISNKNKQARILFSSDSHNVEREALKDAFGIILKNQHLNLVKESHLASNNNLKSYLEKIKKK